MKFPFKNIGFTLLAIYLIIIGLIVLFPKIAMFSMAFGILAIAAGIFILLGK